MLDVAGAAALVLLGSLGCRGAVVEPSIEPDPESESEPPADASAEPAPSFVSLELPESDATVLNPERGFYRGLNLLSPTAAASLRDSGHTIAIALVRLDDYRDRPLDAALLNALDDGFAAARDAGVKVILRFMYNSSFAPDAPKSRIVGHIAQLGPVLEANDDVIFVMQAGFIGAWGEWHGSTNGLDNDDDRTEILDALLDALPAHRSVQVRTPMFKAAAFPGSPLSSETVEDEQQRRRVGHHNDCFLASESDYGTYASPVEDWRNYVAQDSSFTAMGGETCAVYTPRTDCEFSLSEMSLLHWTYLNQQYNQAVVNGWVDQGCYAEVSDRLGYRLVALEAVHTEAVAPGGELELELSLANRGFAAPVNRRPLVIALTGSDSRHTVRLDGVDPRDWRPGEPIVLRLRLRIPANASEGSYAISLGLPDDDPVLAADARYSIQLSNEGTWDPMRGDNVLSRQLQITTDAPGPVDWSASDLAEL